MSNIKINIGKDRKGNIVERELDNMLIVGSKNSGKSVFLNSVINTILKNTSPQEVKLILVNTKTAGFNTYKDVPHLLSPIIKDSKKAITQFRALTDKTIMKRHRLFRTNQGVDSLEEYNTKRKKKFPRIVIIIDEFSDIMNQNGGEESITNMRAVGRSVGVNVLLSSSKCGKEIITEDIKDQSDTIIVGTVTADESTYLLGKKGGEKLHGEGDMIYKNDKRDEKIRIKTPWISTEEQKGIAENVIERFPVVEEEDIHTGGEMFWLTKEQLEQMPKKTGSAKIYTIKEIKLYPLYFLHSESKFIFFRSLTAGILKSYDLNQMDIKEIEKDCGVNVKENEQYYKKFLFRQLGKRKEFFIEEGIIYSLSSLKDESSINSVIPLYRNSIKLLPSSSIITKYIEAEIEYLFENPEERNERIYNRLRKLFKQIKKEEIADSLWEGMVVINYCLTDLTGGDKSKAPYLDDIKKENLLRAMKERTCFDILFGEEYI